MSKVMAIPPGTTIKEQLKNRGMTQRDFAFRMNMPDADTNQLLNGDMPLTIEIALKLENVFGLSASFWINLEKIYREKLARIKK